MYIFPSINDLIFNIFHLPYLYLPVSELTSVILVSMDKLVDPSVRSHAVKDIEAK